MSQDKNKEKTNLNEWIKEYESEKKKNLLTPLKLDKIFTDLNKPLTTYADTIGIIDDNMKKCKENYDMASYYKLYTHKIEFLLKNAQTNNQAETLQFIIDYCDDIPFLYVEYLKQLINLIENTSDSLPERVVSFSTMYINLKLGTTVLFHRNYPEAIRLLNASRESAKQCDEFNFTQISTLVIANTLMLMGKFSEAIQLVDMIKVECKVDAFSDYCRGDTLESGNLMPLIFSKEFYRETTDMFEDVKPHDDELTPKVAQRETLQSKIKNNPTVKKLETQTLKLKTKLNEMFEK